jgi:hypothetical protein
MNVILAITRFSTQRQKNVFVPVFIPMKTWKEVDKVDNDIVTSSSKSSSHANRNNCSCRLVVAMSSLYIGNTNTKRARTQLPERTDAHVPPTELSLSSKKKIIRIRSWYSSLIWSVFYRTIKVQIPQPTRKFNVYMHACPNNQEIL